MPFFAKIGIFRGYEKWNIIVLCTDMYRVWTPVKDLEDGIRKAEAARESESRKLKLAQVQLSDEKIKSKRLEDQLASVRQQLDSSRKESDTNNRLHESLVCVQQKQHFDQMKTLEEKYEEELKVSREKISQLELNLESRIQSTKLCAQSELAKERHAWNKRLVSLEAELEKEKMFGKAKDLEMETIQKQLAVCKEVEENLRKEVKQQLYEINSLKLSIEEERNLTADHVTKSESRISQLKEMIERSKLETETKSGLMDKKLRIRKLQLEEAKTTFLEEKAEMAQMRVNLETLLHQEQVLHQNCREELEMTQKELAQVKDLTADDQRESKKKIVEFALREEKFLSQIESVKLALSKKQQRVDELETQRKQALSGFNGEIERFVW